MKMDTKEMEMVLTKVQAVEENKKKLSEQNKARANELLNRMLSSMSPEVSRVSTGDDNYA